MKVMLSLIRARLNFHLNIDNPNVGLGIADSSLFTRGIAFKEDYKKKKMDMLEYTPVETLAISFITPPRQNQF